MILGIMRRYSPAAGHLKGPSALQEQLEKVQIKQVLPMPSAPAVLLGNAEKMFLVFIGMPEAAALLREIRNEPADRPMTHDLVQSVFLGFDLAIRQIIVSKIVDNAFCATLILEQQVTDTNGDWVGRRNEVRIDARPSDCLVLALKNNADIFVTREVFDQVQDVSHIAFDEVSYGGGTSAMIEGLDVPFDTRATQVGEEGDTHDETLEEEATEDKSLGDKSIGDKSLEDESLEDGEEKEKDHEDQE